MGYAEDYLASKQESATEDLWTPTPPKPKPLTGLQELASWGRTELKPRLETPVFGEQGPLAYGYRGVVSSLLPMIKPEVHEGPATPAEKTAEIGGGLLGYAPWFAWTKGAKAVNYLTKGLTWAQRAKELTLGAKTAVGIGALHSLLEDTGMAIGTPEDTMQRLKNAAGGGFSMGVLHNAGILTKAGADKLVERMLPQFEKNLPIKDLASRVLSNFSLGAGMGAAEAPAGQRGMAALTGGAGFALGGLPFDVMGYRKQVGAERTMAAAETFETALKRKLTSPAFKANVAKGMAPESDFEATKVNQTNEARVQAAIDEINKTYNFKPTATDKATIVTGKETITDAKRQLDQRKALSVASSEDAKLTAAFDAKMEKAKAEGKVTPKGEKETRDMFEKLPVTAKQQMVDQLEQFYTYYKAAINAESTKEVERVCGLKIDQNPFASNVELKALLDDGQVKQAMKVIDKIAKVSNIKILKGSIDKFYSLANDIKIKKVKTAKDVYAAYKERPKTAAKVLPKKVMLKAPLPKKDASYGDIAEHVRLVETKLQELGTYSKTIKKVGPNAWAVILPNGEQRFTSESQERVLDKIKSAQDDLMGNLKQVKTFVTKYKNQLANEEEAMLHPIEEKDLSKVATKKIDNIAIMRILKDHGLAEDGGLSPDDIAGTFGVPGRALSGKGYGTMTGILHDLNLSLHSANEDGYGVVYVYDTPKLAESVRAGGAVYNVEMQKYGEGASPKDFFGRTVPPEAKLLERNRAGIVPSAIKEILITPEADPSAINGALKVAIGRVKRVMQGDEVPLIKIRMVYPKDHSKVYQDIDNISTDSVNRMNDMRNLLRVAMKITPIKEPSGKMAMETRRFQQYVIFWQKAMNAMLRGQKLRVGDLIEDVIGGEGIKGQIEKKLQQPVTDELIRQYARQTGLSFSAARYQMNKSKEATLELWKAGLMGGEGERYNVLRQDIRLDTPVTPSIFFRTPTMKTLSGSYNKALGGINDWNMDRGAEQYKASSKGLVDKQGNPVRPGKVRLANLTNEILKHTRYVPAFDADFVPPEGTPPGMALAMQKLSANPDRNAKVVLESLVKMVRQNRHIEDLAMLVRPEEGKGEAFIANFKEVFDAFNSYYRNIENKGAGITVKSFIDSQMFIVDRINQLKVRLEGVKSRPMKTLDDVTLWLKDKVTQREVQVRDTEIAKFYKSSWEKIVKAKDADGNEYDVYKGKKRNGQTVFVPVADVERSIRKYENIRNQMQGEIELLNRVLEHFADVKEATKTPQAFELMKKKLFKQFVREKRNCGYVDSTNIGDFFNVPFEEYAAERKTAVREQEATGGGKIHTGGVESYLDLEKEPAESALTTIQNRRRELEIAIAVREAMEKDVDWYHIAVTPKHVGAEGKGAKYADERYLLQKDWTPPDTEGGEYKLKAGQFIGVDDIRIDPKGEKPDEYHIDGDGWITKEVLDTMAQFSDTVPIDNVDLDTTFGGFEIPFIGDITEPKIEPLTQIQKATMALKKWGPIDHLYRLMRLGDYNANSVRVESGDAGKRMTEYSNEAMRPEMKPYIHELAQEVYFPDPKDRTPRFTSVYYERDAQGKSYWNKATTAEKEFMIDNILMYKGIAYNMMKMGRFSPRLFDYEQQEGSYLPHLIRAPDGTLRTNVTRETLVGSHGRGRKFDIEELRARKLSVETDAGKMLTHYLLDYANTMTLNSISQGMQEWRGGKLMTPALVYMNPNTQEKTLGKLGMDKATFEEHYEPVTLQGMSRTSSTGMERAYALKEYKVDKWLNSMLEKDKRLITPDSVLATYARMKGLIKSATLMNPAYPLWQGYNSVLQTLGPVTGAVAMVQKNIVGMYKNYEIAEKAAIRAGVESANMKEMLRAMYDDLIGAGMGRTQPDGKLQAVLATLEKWAYDKNGITNFAFDKIKKGAIQAWAVEVDKTLRKNPGMDQVDAEILSANIINERMGMPQKGTFNGFWGDLSKLFFLARNNQVAVLRQFTGMFAPLMKGPDYKIGAGRQMLAFKGYTPAELSTLSSAMRWTQASQLLGYLIMASVFTQVTGGSMPWDRKDPNTWLKIGLGEKDASGNEIMFTPPIFKDVRDILELVPPFAGPGIPGASYARNKMDPTLRLMAEMMLGEEIMGTYTQKITNPLQYGARKVLGTLPPVRLALAATGNETLQNIIDLYPRSQQEHIAEFLGVRTSRGWGGTTPAEQNLAYENKQATQKIKQEMDVIDKQMEIAFAKGDMKKMQELAARKYVKPGKGLQHWIKGKEEPMAKYKGLPARYQRVFGEPIPL